MIRPFLESDPLFIGIFGAIVHTRYASAVPAHMIDDGFNDVWRNTQLVHTRNNGATKIMQSPIPDSTSLVEAGLAP